jgi:hypothetical protein
MMRSIPDMSLNIWGRLPTFKIPTHHNTCKFTLTITINTEVISKLYTFLFKSFQNVKIEKVFLP